MAENDGASRTEEATPRRLEEARKEGDVAKSMDLTHAASLAGAFSAVAIGGGMLARNLAATLTPFIAHPDTIHVGGAAGVEVTRELIMAVAPVLFTVMGATMLAGIGGNVVQHGFLFTTAKLRPNLDKLSPAEGFKRLFGIDGLMNFLRSILKLVLTASVAWWVLAPKTHDLPMLISLDPAALLDYSAAAARALMFAVIALMVAGGVLDFLWQRQRFQQRMRMTQEERKEDFKQSEGDPHVKARQRQIRTQRARRRMIQQVPKATVVIANPTHFAVALRYEQGETPAPLCVAKGMDAVALKIREIAEGAGVPVIEDAPLARALYAVVDVDQVIPHDHYEAVAKIIGFILAAKRPRRRARTL
jgi:flagellar biosynthesis protein FlhB